MTVAELINMLQPLQQDAEILFTPDVGYGDCSPTSNIEVDQSDSETTHFIAADEVPSGTETRYWVCCNNIHDD